MSAHTPTPWHAVKGIDQMVDPGTTVHHRDGWGVYSDADHHGDAQADAEFIARACNSHDALVQILQTTAGNIRSLGAAGALDIVPMPYRIWLEEVEKALTAAGAA